MVEELFQGGVCGGTWWNPTLFSGGGGGGSTPCSVAQLGGGCYDISGFGWSHEIMKSSRFNNNDTLLCDNNINNNNNDKNYNNNNNNNNNINNLVFSADFDSTFDILGFGISPTTSTIDWNKKNPFCKSGNFKESYDDRSIFHGSLNSKSNYEDLGPNIQKLIDSTKFPNQNESQYTTMTTSSNNSPGDNSSSISYEGGMATNFQINSSTSYLIQTLFDDNVDNEPLLAIPQPISRLIDPINDFAGSMDRHQVSNCSWDKSCDDNSIPLVQSSNSDYNTATISSDIRAAFDLKSLTWADNHSTKLKHEETRHESKKNSNNDQPTAKRARIETPSSLPTFKVRKEKLGDRITALQQLVSPFGKTDTASVLHEAIEYIKFLHDQVHVLSTPYLKNGEMFVEHRQVSDDNEELDNKDLRSRGLCLVPISSTYPVTHETPIDFWTPKFG